MRRQFLSPRSMKFWCSAVVVATLGVLGASNAFTDCNDQTCIEACKAHPTWCWNTGVMGGGTSGVKFFTDNTFTVVQKVALVKCVENGDHEDGTPATQRAVWYKAYSSCSLDCPNNAATKWTTGSVGATVPFGDDNGNWTIECEI
ncbi:MAG: hypothetical protein R3C19_08065 [Planctomycetaceae bacterium]